MSSRSCPTKARPAVSPKSRPANRVSDVIANAAKMSGKDVSEFQAVIDGGGAAFCQMKRVANSKDGLSPDPTASRTSPPRTSSRKWSRHASTNWTHWAVPDGSERERIMNIASIAESEACNPDDYGKVARVHPEQNRPGHAVGHGSMHPVA